MNTEFALAVAASAVLVTAMIALRLAAGGAAARQIAGLVAELWAVLALWLGLCVLIGRMVGEPTGASWREELGDLAARLRALGPGEKLGMVVGLACGTAGCAHVLLRVGRAVERFDVTGGGEEIR